jgi:predicted Zn-dependent protease
MIREADFAYRQAFALCPHSPEAVWRYANFLVNQRRFADALAVAEIGLALHKGKPDADSFETLVKVIKSYNDQTSQSQSELPPLPIDK